MLTHTDDLDINRSPSALQLFRLCALCNGAAVGDAAGEAAAATASSQLTFRMPGARSAMTPGELATLHRTRSVARQFSEEAKDDDDDAGAGAAPAARHIPAEPFVLAVGSAQKVVSGGAVDEALLQVRGRVCGRMVHGACVRAHGVACLARGRGLSVALLWSAVFDLRVGVCARACSLWLCAWP